MAGTTTATEPGYSINYESSSGGDVSVNHGTVVGDYHSHEELQANTPTQHLDQGSSTNVTGHFTNFHDYDVHENSNNHFNYENGANAQNHEHPAFEQHHEQHHEQQGPFEHSAGHETGNTHGGGHESGHGSSQHDGSHADGSGVSH